MKSGTWRSSPKRSRVPFSGWGGGDTSSDDDTDNEAELVVSSECGQEGLSSALTALNIDKPIYGLYARRPHSKKLNVDTENVNDEDVKIADEAANSSTKTSQDRTLEKDTPQDQKKFENKEVTGDVLKLSPSVRRLKSEEDSKSTVGDFKKADATPAKTSPGNPTSPIRGRSLMKRGLSRQQSMTASNRLEVGVKMKVRLEFIDDVSHEVNSLVYLSLHYEDEEALRFVTNQPGFCALDPEKEGIFVPVVNFLNTRVCEHVEGFRVLVNTQTGMVFIYRIYRVVFRNIMNLKRFPFDRQVMKCHIKSFTAIFKPWSAPVSTIPSGITSDKMWTDNDCVVECDCTLWDVSWVTGSAEMRTQPSVYKLNFGISRISLFYVVNFFLITFLVVMATLSCTIIHFTDFASRSSITFTILLTIISFKFIMANYTPTINYLTLFDYYNITGTISVILVIFQNFTIAHYPNDPEYAAQMDHILYYYFGSLWLFLHMVLFIGSFTGLFYEDWVSVLSNDDMLCDIQRVHNKQVSFT